MKISIPLQDNKTEMVETNVTDTTKLFDNSEYVPFYPINFKYRHEGEIFINNGEQYYVPLYNALDTYVLGQIVFKDDTIQKVVSGTAPKAPNNYSIVSNGYDESLWSSRYARLQTVPSTYGQTLTRSTYVNGHCFSQDGYHYFECTSENIYQWILTTPYDISEVGPYGTENGRYSAMPFWGDVIRDIAVSADGSKIYWVVDTSTTWRVYVATMTTPFNLNTATNRDSTDYTAFMNHAVSIHFNSDGSKLYLGGINTSNQADIIQISLVTNWDIKSVWTFQYRIRDYIPVLADPYLNSGCQSVQFNSDGTKLYAYYQRWDGLKAIYQIDLATGWVLNTATLDGIKKVNDTIWNILRTPTGFWTHVQGRFKFYTNLTTDDIIYSFHSPYDHIVNEFRGGYIYEYRWRTIYGVTTFYFAVYNSSTLARLYETTYEGVYIYSQLTNESQDISAELVNYEEQGGWLGVVFVIDSTGFYVRTHLPLPIEIVTTEELTYAPVLSPAELPYFVYIEVTNPNKPFDGKNYTYAVTEDTMTYTIQGLEQFDTLALGNVKAGHIDVLFKDEQGAIITTIDSDIDTTRDTHGHLPDWYTTIIVYSDSVMPIGSTIELTLTPTAGSNVELATLLLGISAEAGFTNLSLKNEYKDFSNFEQDQWGNVDYTERAKVSRYSGTVDIPITSYDMTDRLMTSLGANLVIVNGSDDGSCGCDSYNIFNATQKIGRFMSFNQQTKIKDDEMNVIATYSFTLEEIV